LDAYGFAFLASFWHDGLPLGIAVCIEVDLAWNGPLAYVKIRRALAEPCRVVAMRDIDVGYTTQSAA
jgi:hypothetical protein